MVSAQANDSRSGTEWGQFIQAALDFFRSTTTPFPSISSETVFFPLSCPTIRFIHLHIVYIEPDPFIRAVFFWLTPHSQAIPDSPSPLLRCEYGICPCRTPFPPTDTYSIIIYLCVLKQKVYSSIILSSAGSITGTWNGTQRMGTNRRHKKKLDLNGSCRFAACLYPPAISIVIY